LFNADNTKLSADGQAVLDGVIAELQADDKSRVQLMAYAAGEDLSSSKARRISLSRALSVRSYLIEKGVRSTRIDVRALGDKAEGDQKNRVDVNMIAQ
jgi:outer membrane protein OmpA-like peptidoglycan-associated protein